MGWLIALAVLFLFAMIPVGALVRYDAQGFYMGIVVGFVRIRLFPLRKKSKQARKKDEPEERDKKEQNKPDDAKPKTEPSGKGGSLKDFIPIIQLAMEFLNHFRKMLRVDHLRLKLILAGDDPCDLAVNYGRAWAALGNFLPLLERVVVLKKRDCEVECDFNAQQTTVVAQAEITLRIWQGFFLVSVYGFRFIKELLTLKKKRKGGVVS